MCTRKSERVTKGNEGNEGKLAASGAEVQCVSELSASVTARR